MLYQRWVQHTFQWWRIPCSQDLLGWKECRRFACIVSLKNLIVATAGTNTRNTTFKIVHSDLLNKT